MRWMSGARSILNLSLIAMTPLVLSAQTAEAASALQSTRLLRVGTSVRELSLDGTWQVGIDRHYGQTTHVPGLFGDPSKPAAGTLWYKRTVEVPVGGWTHATLTLKGARFAPRVYVDGTEVSSAEGGMAATTHTFPLPASGKSAVLEIALASLTDLDTHDASAVPGADLWRNNVASYLWDSVVLRLHGAGEIARVSPSADLGADTLSVRWEVKPPTHGGQTLTLKVLDQAGAVVVASKGLPVAGTSGTQVLALRHHLAPWSPEHPHLYRLRTELRSDGTLVDATEQSLGLRQFAVDGLHFHLNGEPYTVRMGTVVWHRWTRDPEAQRIAFDPAWFESNVVQRLKGLGANALRFHLGLPPEEFLDLCDRDGLAVQMEWPFFHGISASPESLRVQWTAWLDTAMRHPSVVILHPWNETGEEQAAMADTVLDSLLTAYPPMVVAHRDAVPIHKYWWSLFENVGLYYDSAAQFGKAVMVDEFGGDYLDGNGDPGGYPATRETFLRFLGRDNSREERLQLQADANARIGEYWRRLGVAGYSPFCILGSPQDGNHWFLGPEDVPSPAPKPVWSALSALWAPRSVSLEIWNRNFAPGETIRVPLWFFNDDGREQRLKASVHIIRAESSEDEVPAREYVATVRAHGSATESIDMTMPKARGAWRIEARLEDPRPAVPVVSSWRIRTVVPEVSAGLRTAAIGVAREEVELRAMLEQFHLRVVDLDDPSARVLAGSRATWQRLRESAEARADWNGRLRRGVSLVLLDAGPRPLGVGYESGGKLGGPLEGAPTVAAPAVLEETTLFDTVRVSFPQVAEPESTLQTAERENALWQHIPRGSTWLWNGLRGGLIVPAADMQLTGAGGRSEMEMWTSRGADLAQAAKGRYNAYQLAGYYAFGFDNEQEALTAKLRQRVRFLVEDAPSLRGVVNPEAPIVTTPLSGLLLQQTPGQDAPSITVLANAGKNLTRSPVVQLTFGPGAGTVVLSQLLTEGRLLPGPGEPGPGVYGLRHDPIAVQMVLNMLDASIGTQSATRP